MEKVLIVAPHLDDEVLGCSSFLLDDSLERHVVYMTEHHPGYPQGENIAENRRLVEHLGINAQYKLSNYTNELDQWPYKDILSIFEMSFNHHCPDTVLLPFPSYNQDHRVIYETALTALRPHDKNWFVKRVLLYEQPETFGSLRKVESFRPTYFKPIDIGKKIELYRIYKSQLRDHRSSMQITAIAKVRGMQSNMPHAEAFEVVRWVV